MTADRQYEGFFGESVASRYDAGAADMFDPAVVTPVVELLEELAGEAGHWSSGSARDASRSRSSSVGCPSPGSTTRRRW